MKVHCCQHLIMKITKQKNPAHRQMKFFYENKNFILLKQLRPTNTTYLVNEF